MKSNPTNSELNSRKYYTLLQFDRHIMKWVIVFGDYELETVQDERDDLKDNYDNDFYYKPIYRIVNSSDMQSDIENLVNYLNAHTHESSFLKKHGIKIKGDIHFRKSYRHWG